MKTLVIFLVLTAATIALQTHAQEKKQNDTNVFYEITPDGWECRIIKENFSNDDIPRNSPTPEIIVKYYNPKREFKNCNSIEQEQVHPSLILNLYPINRKNELSAIIKSQRYYSHCIPIYYGETNDYFITTSPCFKNKGVYTDEADSSIEDLYLALDRVIEKRENRINENLKFEKN